MGKDKEVCARARSNGRRGALPPVPLPTTLAKGIPETPLLTAQFSRPNARVQEKLTKEEKAAKKAKKEAKKAKREAEEEPVVEEAPPAKKSKKDKGEETKEEKAARKAAKKAAKLEEDAPAPAPTPAFAPPAAPAPAPAADGGSNRVFMGNLPFKMTEDWMKSLFEGVGTVSNIEWLMHADTGKWKGAVFITMGSEAEAAAASAKLNGQDCEGRPMKVEVAHAKKSFDRPPQEENPPSESVFLGNLSWTVDEDSTRALFADCGSIVNLKWLIKDGEFRGMAFLDFDSVESATKAVALTGSDLCGRPLRCNFSKPKDPSKSPAGGAGGWPAKPQRPSKPQGEKPEDCVELFCGNLPWTIDEAKISEFFSKCGAKVNGTRWLNDKETGEFKGIGFVSFESTGDVDKAVALGGEMLDGRPIRLDYAGGQKKKEGAWQGNSW